MAAQVLAITLVLMLAGQVMLGGVLSRVITTSSWESGQTPFNKVQRRVFAPSPNPVSPDVGLLGLVMVAVPETTVQVPVPVVGEFPDRVAVVPQTAWFNPAFAVVEKLTVTATDAEVAGSQPAPVHVLTTR